MKLKNLNKRFMDTTIVEIINNDKESIYKGTVWGIPDDLLNCKTSPYDKMFIKVENNYATLIVYIY